MASSESPTLSIGSQMPAAVYEVDFSTEQLISTLPPGGQKYETVYACSLLPPDFDQPPKRLEVK